MSDGNKYYNPETKLFDKDEPKAVSFKVIEISVAQIDEMLGNCRDSGNKLIGIYETLFKEGKMDESTIRLIRAYISNIAWTTSYFAQELCILLKEKEEGSGRTN
jgi:hypothetical protein